MIKYEIPELMRLLNEYTQDPYNHECCSFKPPLGSDDTDESCDCDLHAHLEQFVLWLRDRKLKELK